jgi:hypothetical protein
MLLTPPTYHNDNMDFQARQGWNYPTPDSMYAVSQSQSPFSANVSSYFRRPVKVVKSGSRNTSPRHIGRRRTTTTNVPVGRTRSVIDKQPASQQSSRPVSWHPNVNVNAYPEFSFNGQVDFSYQDVSTTYQQPDFYNTATVNGLVTPMSQPVIDEPQIQELITPLEGLTAAEMGQQTNGNVYGYPYWTDGAIDKSYPTIDNMFAQPMMQQAWQWNTQNIPTAPASPSFLPTQGTAEASPLDLNTRISPQKSSGEELVAMGLYDSPAEVQSSSLLFGGSGRKRSLKLEESFEPPPEAEKEEKEDENEDSEGEPDDELEQQDDADEVVPFPEFPVHAQHMPNSNMAGQSFFFETDPSGGISQQPVYPQGPGGFSMNGDLLNQGMSYGWF